MAQTLEDLKLIEFPHIFSHSFRTIRTWNKLFAQITFTLLLPLTLIFIAHIEISMRLFNQIERDPFSVFTAAFDSYQSYFHTGASSAAWRRYLLFKSLSIAGIGIFSLLSAASVVFTIASVYTGRDVTFRKSMKSVPQIWKRLAVTFLFSFVTLFAFCLLASVVNFLFTAAIGEFAVDVLPAVDVISAAYFLYLTAVWQLATVVSVLESSRGLKSMLKAMDLMKGKTKSALMIACILYPFLAVAITEYMSMVDGGAAVAPVSRVMIRIVCAVMILIVFLLFNVTQTVLYLVCKLHHGETIDPVSLSTYLGAYLSDSRPVFRTGEDIQLGRAQNQVVSQV
ncbi:hypothetical protein SSX86_000504 [Deinandra increscens subsp. villosa]|uniref:Uncharacterized protein n=1 Tax=Deinandra increscens subsp. villosa TaxID=3103831 RepID=A0AAP0HDJ0_9ASTR